MAYEAYLKGRYHLDRLVPDELDKSLKYFELALEKDPDSATAYTGIVAVWVCRNQMRIVPPEEARPQAIAAITKAHDLDSVSAEAHYISAIIKTWMQWEWEAAETAFLRTLELNPNHGHARAFYGHYLSITKRDQEAVEQSLEAIGLDPMNPLFRILYGIVLVNLHRYDDALEQFHDAKKFGANNFVMHDGLQCVYHGKGLLEDSYGQ
jgi:tetratricopeptide (TPR) repeat protein